MLGAARARAVTAGSLILLLAALFSLASLIPGFIIVRVSSAELVRDGERVARSPDGATAEDREMAAHAARLILALQSLASSTPTAVDAITSVLAAKPSGVSVRMITYVRGETSALSFSGLSADREGIQEYRTVLSKDSRFTSISVPVGTLLGASAGQFTITTHGSF